ncbi:MAG: hypothetical protein JKX93_12945 [Rhizobiaceae bacterium]|nr:hypothetical protein [Rhizobiaceae bacterium]MBL4695383.1 hypothetical protein [Rhizobiaceae bacterium]
MSALDKVTNTVAFNLIIFSFLLHFVWEFVQAPTYAGMIEMNHWDGIKLCMSATFGDVGFALVAYFITSLVARSRDWVFAPSVGQLLLFLGVGIALTVGFEYYYTNISLRWTYSELMPLVPPLGTGLSPLLQWIFIPLLVLWFIRRQISQPEKELQNDG